MGLKTIQLTGSTPTISLNEVEATILKDFISYLPSGTFDLLREFLDHSNIELLPLSKSFTQFVSKKCFYKHEYLQKVRDHLDDKLVEVLGKKYKTSELKEALSKIEEQGEN